jgi:DNA-binding response OmpR family regulator
MPFSSHFNGGSSAVLDEGVHLLFADDDPILREFATVHLATEGGGVITAEDGEEAWTMLQQQPVDLLLVDLEMPKLDGFDLVQRLRATPRFASLPVIVVTGREDVSAIDRAFRAGATSFVSKPINWRLLSYQLRFVLRAQMAEASLSAAHAGAGDQGLRFSESIRQLLNEGSELLNLAIAGDEPLRQAARRYASTLQALSRTAAATRAA